MSANKWNSFLLSLFCLLLVLCSSGYALKCFNCPATSQPCTTNHTCPQGDYSCLKVTVGTKKIYQCELHSKCNLDALQKDFPDLSSFSFSCCQGWDLCNAAVTTPVHKTLFGLFTLIAVLWLF